MAKRAPKQRATGSPEKRTAKPRKYPSYREVMGEEPLSGLEIAKQRAK